jgi:nucleotide-binding universal stress UspA family protein
MATIKKILVPTDFSHASRHALLYAGRLADALGASLCILHAIESPYLPGGYMEYYPPPEDFYEQLERRAHQDLEALLSAEDRDKYHATFELRQGRAAHEILEYLREHTDIDLVVMATHGRGGVARLMLGSVADKVVRAAPVPVTTIRTPEAEKATTKNAA